MRQGETCHKKDLGEGYLLEAIVGSGRKKRNANEGGEGSFMVQIKMPRGRKQ